MKKPSIFDTSVQETYVHLLRTLLRAIRATYSLLAAYRTDSMFAHREIAQLSYPLYFLTSRSHHPPPQIGIVMGNPRVSQ
jgi:hypothetical protein